MSLGTSARAVVWILVAVCAWFAPAYQDTLLRKWERAAARFAAHRVLSCVAIALVVLLTRLVLLPVWQIPKPYIWDEFGYILQADTFASGRLTNPPHPMAPFFESIYVLQSPTYNAKFPPGQGLMLSVGKIIFDQPWFGAWLSCGLLAAALCWALQGWFPPAWALFGSVIALPLCIFSYWMNSYWGGAVTAIGSAFVIGAIPRIRKKNNASWLLAIGFVLQIYTRPFEGCLLLAPIFLMLVFLRLEARSWAAILLIGAFGAAWLGYYNYRVTGSPVNLPYLEYDRQYPSTPHVNVLPLPPPHQFAHLDFTLMDRWEREAWARARSAAFITTRFGDVTQMLNTFLGSMVLLIPVALFWRNLFHSARLKLLWWCLLTGCIAIAIGTQYYEHYAAPILPVILILAVQAFRHLRVFEYSGRPIGKFLCRAMPAVMLVLAAGSQAAQLYRAKFNGAGYYPNTKRDPIEETLAEQPGGHVIFVRYTNYRFPQEEWIYNHADIDNAPVVWAQDMGPLENRRLMEYFKGRTFWLLKPDENASRPEPYSASDSQPK